MNKEINIFSNVGLYIRLSREDNDKIEMSESITNQKSLLTQYVKENSLRLVDIYIDDGYSGTNFDRPEFKRMINDILKGKINMVITKDMSRLGRDYVGTGELIEKFFPSHGVRYIAVTDNIDTYLDNSNNDVAPFKAIMNDMYAKDISKKIKSSLRAKQKEGKWVGGRTPFGYRKDPNNKNKLIIFEEQAVIVRRIFDMCLEGLTCYKIALKLTNEKVKTPAGYYSFEWKNNYHLNYEVWNAKTVKDILTNRMYIGDLVQNKRSKVNYKIKKIIKNNPEDYIVVENTHKPIIEKEIFYEIQKRIPKNIGRNEKKEKHLLDGLLYCGNCGHRISITSRRKKDNRCYTICNYYRSYMKNHVCTTHSNNYDELEKIIINSLTNLYLNNIDKNIIKYNILNNFNKNNELQNKKELKILSNNIKQLNNNLDTIYIDKLNKKITEEQYIRVKDILENELNIKTKKYNDLNNNVNTNINEKIVNKYIDNFLSMKEHSRELIINLIDKIEIFDDKTINIKVAFNNLIK